jgi:hypothetical protein
MPTEVLKLKLRDMLRPSVLQFTGFMQMGYFNSSLQATSAMQ